MKTTFLIFFNFIVLMLMADRNQDSLINALKNNPDDSLKCDAFSQLAWVFIRNDPDSALHYVHRGMMLSEKIGYKTGTARLYNAKGQAYRVKNDIEKALDCYVKAAELNLKLGSRGELDLAANYGNMGGIYQKRAALTQNKVFREKAVEYYKMAREIFERLGNKNGIIGCHIEMGIIYHDLGRYKESLNEYEPAMKMMEQMNYKPGLRMISNNMGSTYLQMKEFEKAEALYLKSLKIQLELNDTLELALTYNNLANTAIGKKEWQKGISYAEKALAEAVRKRNLLEICTSAKRLKHAYSNLGHYQKAFEYSEMQLQYKDSVVNESSNRQMQELEGQFQNEKKQLEIDNLNKEKQLQAEEAKRQNLQKMAFASGFILMLLLAVIVYRGYHRKKKDHEIIKHQKEIVEEQKKEIVDSIRYAQRIQRAHLPSEKYIARNMDKLLKEK